jgi:hypothetical protein
MALFASFDIVRTIIKGKKLDNKSFETLRSSGRTEKKDKRKKKINGKKR